MIKIGRGASGQGRLCYALPSDISGDIAELHIAEGLRAEENMESVAPEPVVEEIGGS